MSGTLVTFQPIRVPQIRLPRAPVSKSISSPSLPTIVSLLLTFFASIIRKAQYHAGELGIYYCSFTTRKALHLLVSLHQLTTYYIFHLQQPRHPKHPQHQNLSPHGANNSHHAVVHRRSSPSCFCH
jgi:hypothetical protein